MRAARVLPLALLMTLLATAIVTRVRCRSPRAHAPSVGSAVVTSGVPAPPGRAWSKPPDAGVSAHAARMLHGDAHRTHRAHGRGPKTAKLVWQTELDGAVEAQVVASPDEQTLYAVTHAGSLVALAKDGSKRWTAALGDRVYSTPCVADDGTIYVGSDAKRFFAIAPDGRIKWKLEVDADSDTGAVITREGAVIFAAGASVYAVRAGGDVAWRFQAKGKVFTAPAIQDDGTIVFGAQDDHVYALAKTGALAWSIDLGADVDGAPAIGDDGAIFVGTDGDEVVRLTPSGEIAWRAKVGGFVRGPLAIARNGDVLAGVYGPTPREVRLRAFDGAPSPEGGSLSVPGTGAREFGVHGGALEDDDGMLYFGAQDDDVYAVDPAGAIAWRFRTGGDVDAPLTLLPTGELIAASDDGRVYLFAPGVP